ncbi:MAG: cyclic beta 1-2 glucan synthetase [Gemmatimonadaceae bacterium]|nr:cyclic beta 1-2 glucan synthetase [Chitinophagaceae bacterium]
MKVSWRNKNKELIELLPQAIAKLKKNIIDPFLGENNNLSYINERAPLRAEIFTREKLEQHAVTIAKRHELVYNQKSEQLLERLADNEHILLEVYALVSDNLKKNNRISPAAEWLVDNFYLIEEQIYTGKKHLPKGYSKTLPRLLKGELARLPRVYDMAVEIISHSDGHVDMDKLTGFVNAYQTVDKLKLGELWAIPIMLRLGLIENLRRLSILIAEEIANRTLANRWADEMIEVSEKNPKNLVLVIADMARSEPPMESTFVAELNRRLLEKGNTLSLPLNWIEQTLAELGVTTGQLIQLDNQNQAATQVSVSNCISSFRFLSTTNWRDFVEETSIVEATLRQDIGGIYGKMDFHTRDQYRHVVEKIAYKSKSSEQVVAESVLQAAKDAASNNNPKQSHVGYYLRGKGYNATANAANVKISISERCSRIRNRHPLPVYLGSISILTFLICWLLIAQVAKENLSAPVIIAVCFVALLSTTRFAISLVNWFSTILIKPTLLPRMDFSKGIPSETKTMVVIPSLITGIEAINNLLEGLEVRFLANRDANLYFGLLTDFKDAASEHLPEDESLVLAIKNGIIELNKKYGRTTNDTFFLFHRPRKWNNYNKIWMGYERKRGKLGDLNALLREKGDGCFSEIVGDVSCFGEIKFIITLDTDTQLPRDTAWKMIGTMAHPLNHPVYNKKKNRVTEGYGILQPRVSNSLPATESSIYARLFGNDPGTDPYTKASSDVYQDLFEEGSYIGKGIYDLDAFELALKDKLPENRILSHDLLEGSYARSGLISDVQLYEEYPHRYDTDMQRRHRWIRGDWQIWKWVLPFVPGYNRKLLRNPISLISRWKVFDNIRRSLIPICQLLLLLFGWTLSSVAWFWTLTVTLIIVLPSLVNFFWELYRKPSDVIFIQHLLYTSRTALDNFVQQMLDLVFLPYEVFLNIDAIVRTLWRVHVSQKNLLQWNPYNRSRNMQDSVIKSYAVMWFEPVFALLVYIFLTFYNTGVLLIALPFLIFWMIAPAIAFVINRPWSPDKMAISEKQTIYLRRLSRKIWGFFERFVTAEENWLPPDNYQEEPVERIAHRTSPTNIGLSLLSSLSAYDFGYITSTELLQRTANTVHTVQRMEKYRGHLYNWYDTISLAPLLPKYISSVDSGNMAGHLITLKQGLLALPHDAILHENFFSGLSDTVIVLLENDADNELLLKFCKDLEMNHKNSLQSIRDLDDYLSQLQISFTNIISTLKVGADPHGQWSQKALHQISQQRNQLAALTPWLLFSSIPAQYASFVSGFPPIPSLNDIAFAEHRLLNANHLIETVSDDADNDFFTKFRTAIAASAGYASELIRTIETLAVHCMELSNMDYDFLFDRSQNLLSIGYHTEDRRRDNSFYDLLASEARLTTLVGIAQGKLPQESWFALGRQLSGQGGAPVLLSWGGSMFEYLMPLLVMPTFDKTLLDQTYKAVVRKQIEYGNKHSIPWGMSESGYNMVDAHLNYQYRSFGVPGIGFKRGLGEDLVISPYSTVLALMVAPNAAYSNLQTLKEEGYEGDYGFYEAIDYTSTRLQKKQKSVVIRSFMSHHQGMSLLALSYLLHNRPMQKRFESEVHLQSTLLLLQERIPRVTTFYSPSVHAGDLSIVPGSDQSIRVVDTPNLAVPEIQLLSNGNYHVMVTSAGGGYSRWKNIAITRWREDITCDNWGNFCFIRDLESGSYWSSAFQPTLQAGESYEAVFSEGRAEFRRRDFSLETHTEIVVSPEDDIQLKRVQITNRSRRKRVIEITTYSEVVLAAQAADEAHPAFSNLFVQTEISELRNAILCTRRPRSTEEKTPWMFHLMKVHNAEIINVSYETDREKFIGRGNTIHHPQAVRNSEPLSNSSGSVLDPIVSIQYRIVLEGNASVTIDIITGASETKEGCSNLIDKYQAFHLFNRVLELAWTHSQVILRQLNAVETDAQLYSRLAGSILFSNQSFRADPAVISKNKLGQSGLWRYSISGDIPIVLVQIENVENILLVKKMIQAHHYWRLKGLIVDLVILNEDRGGYRQELHNLIHSLITPGLGTEMREKPGGIFIRAAEQISNEERSLFEAVAHVVISDKFGTLEEQMNRKIKSKTALPFFVPVKTYPLIDSSVEKENDLQFYNGLGGFTADGKEYVITTTPDKKTPAPWINVLANPDFGCIVSESGLSYTWVDNAHEIRLTPWNNDPITDLKGEAFYLKDEESGRFWSPSPLPCRGTTPYISRHGFGYSKFEHSEDGIYSEMTMFTDIEAPVKFIVIRVRNESGRQRRISATGYMDWVLGDLRTKYHSHTITELDERSGAILISNNYSSEFVNRIAFFDAEGTHKTITTDRTEFIGRNGTLTNPEGLRRVRLSGKTGAALDSCGAIQVVFDLEDEQAHEVIFRLGAGKNMEHALEIIQATEGTQAANNAMQKVHDYWQKTLRVVQIYTPDPALNILANGWLNYQTLASRLWARSGFYQSGGAFGFRDQLQDVLSLVHAHPGLVRSQIVLCASRQFKQGDVQHWWHPPTGRGVRTTCSDDYLWLPYVTSKYIEATGDTTILDEQIHFLEGRELAAGEDSFYDLFVKSNDTADLYGHCVKAIDFALKFGAHGLPFIGSGDWNDGMDKVGNHGKGESVWLGFFLYDVLVKFAEVAILRKEENFAIKCKNVAEELRINIREHAWDGEWYRRAYFDDGTPLGSHENEECKIDSIAQSWSVLSGAGDSSRIANAMQSADTHLVRKEEGIIQLFNPPFDKSNLNPGYIKGYVPGVRENGGQYTHAAIWLVMAFAAVGDKKRTWELLQMINPINRTSSEEKIARYKTEPYVIAADVYAEPKHKGQGGWTWYTGSAGWMYQLIIHSFIGLKRVGNTLSFSPCLPEEWKTFELHYWYLNTVYRIVVTQKDSADSMRVIVDGVAQDDKIITLADDGVQHTIQIDLNG